MFKKCLNILYHSKLHAVLGKVLAPSSVFRQHLRNGYRLLIAKKELGHSLQIFPKHLIASHMTSSLQN